MNSQPVHYSANMPNQLQFAGIFAEQAWAIPPSGTARPPAWAPTSALNRRCESPRQGG